MTEKGVVSALTLFVRVGIRPLGRAPLSACCLWRSACRRASLG